MPETEAIPDIAPAPPSNSDHRAAGGLTVRGQVAPSSVNEEARTFEVIWATETPVRNYDWSRGIYFDQILSFDPAHVRMDRMNSGAPLLDTHGRWSLDGVIGSVVAGSAQLDADQGRAMVQIGRTPELESLWRMVADGHIRNVSVGFTVYRYEDISEPAPEGERARYVYRAVDWEPMEISLVPVPADPNAQIRSADALPFPPVERSSTTPQERTASMPTPNPAPNPASDGSPAENVTTQARGALVSQVLTLTRAADMPQADIDALTLRAADGALTFDQLTQEVGTAYAARQNAAPTQARVQVTRDEGDTQREAMVDGLCARLGGRGDVSEPARDYRRMSLRRLAETSLLMRGVSLQGLSEPEIAERSLHVSSDFPNILANALRKRLRSTYEENLPSYQMFARRAPNAIDFKTMDVTQLSNLPDLLKVNEAGEVTYGTMADGKESYKILTYSRGLSITRQTIINDDLRALEDLSRGFSGAARRLENRLVYAQLTSNPTMSDGIALFNAAHNNLDGAAAISAVTLGAGRTRMRLQKGLQSEELNIAPRYLIVPAALEQLAYQFTSSQFVPAAASAINEFRAGGRTALEPIVEAVLDGVSASQWYLAADSAQIDTIEYCYLEGYEGVQLASQIGFDIDGIKVKGTLDFAAKVIDHRGLYRNG